MPGSRSPAPSRMRSRCDPIAPCTWIETQPVVAPGSSQASIPTTMDTANETGPVEEQYTLPADLTPPVDCIKVTEDGGVLKHIVTEGTGDPPVLHARCLVHFTGRCLPGGDVFMSSKEDSQAQEPYLVVAGRDASARETGLNLAVATMRPGEQAHVYVTDPKYGYGEKGSFSFPSVPPSCQLVYEVEMITWEQPAESIDRRSMLYEERLEAAERRRKEGNQLFAAGRYTEALAKYALALSYCDEDFMLQLHGAHLDKAEEVTNPVFLNMAAAQLKLGDYATAAHNATQVLMRDPKHLKALFRRAKARAAMGRTQEALEDLLQAAAIDPGDREIQKELRALKQLQREEHAAGAKLFKGALGPPPKPKSAAEQAAAAAAGNSSATSSQLSANGSSRQQAALGSSSSGLIQQLFAVFALIYGWLQQCLRSVLHPQKAVPASRHSPT